MLDIRCIDVLTCNIVAALKVQLQPYSSSTCRAVEAKYI